MGIVLDRGGPRPKHVVYSLSDGSGRIGFIGARRNDRPKLWKDVFWQRRAEIDIPLTRWFKMLDSLPEERILVGASVGLHAAAARQIAEMLREIIGGTVEPNKTPGRRRPTGKIKTDGGVDFYESQAAAGRAMGVTRWAARQAVRRGRLLDLAGDF